MSDPISRNQIYSYVKTIINPYGKPFKGTAYELGLKIMDYIKNMSSVELPVRGEWIPVKERLPEEEYDTVLAVTNAKHYAVYVYTSEHGFRIMDIDAIGEVIAWMPLPAPYDMRKKVE